MNRHFQDTRYYLERAFQTTKAGLGEELDPVKARVDALRGRQAEPDPSRFETIRTRMLELQRRAQNEFERVRRSRTTR